MDLPRHCAQCGAMLSVYALEGVCGNCLLKPGLEPMLEHGGCLGSGSDSSGTAGKPTRFGDYELIEEIARGGMGIVYRARQVSLDRIVAVKMLLAGQLAGKDFVQRFRTEAAAAASLQHPNIVAIHEVGFAQGQHFFAMDYVEGVTLAQLVAKGPLPARTSATYLRTVAEAIHFAHERSVLHRDLKPSNVIIDSATDQPRITDFGLAKRLDSETELTLSGQLLGSPNYVSPEQATAKRGTVGRRSDVYSLGAILYHLLTGRPPFQSETLTDILRQLADNDPPSPRLFAPRVPQDLETICMKCLQKEPSRRYQSAEDLADELDRFLHHKPIHARPVTGAERAWRWCGRNPVVAGLGLGLILAIIGGFAGVLLELRRVRESESIVEGNLYTSDMNLAHQVWTEGNLQSAQDLLARHLPKPGQEDLRGFEWRYLTNLCRDESSFTFTNIHFAGERRGLALAADGRVIAASGDTLQWLDWQKRSVLQSSPVGPIAIAGLTMASDQPGLVAYRTDRIKAFSSLDEAILGVGIAAKWGGFTNPGWGGAFALSRDGALLAASGTNFTVRLFDMKTGQPLGPEFYLGKYEGIVGLAFSPDRKYLACGTDGNHIHILEAPLLKRIHLLTNHTAFVTCLAFDREGRKLVSGGNDGHIRVWTFPECALVADLHDHQGWIADLTLSPDGLRLASAGSDHTVRLWNVAGAGAPTFSRFLHGHRGAVRSVLFSRNGSQLYTGSDDGTVKVWDLYSHESTNVLRHPGYMADVALSPDGTLVAVAEWSRSAILWQLPNQQRIGPVGDGSDAYDTVKFSPDGKTIATGGDPIQVWTASPIKKQFDLIEAKGASSVHTVNSLAFHPQEPILAVACVDLRLWNLKNGAPLKSPPGTPTNGIRSAAFSPDGKALALGMLNGTVSILSFPSGHLIRSFQQHSKTVASLCFSHDGNFLASGGNDHRAFLYDLRRGVTVSLDGHKDEVPGMAFAPGDKTLASACQDGYVRLWSVTNHEVVLKLTHDGGGVTSVVFSTDGNLMATSGADGTVRLWPAANLELLLSPVKSSSARQRVRIFR